MWKNAMALRIFSTHGFEGLKVPNVKVYCDEIDDKHLFDELIKMSGLEIDLGQEFVFESEVYPHYDKCDVPALVPLIMFDRPDWVFFADGKPILVVEITEHAYTGDNSLQRFTRAANACENKVPFVYFGPFSRVRDDELDSDRKASERHLSSDFFLGLFKLKQVFVTDVFAVKWSLGSNGKPLKPSSKNWDKDLFNIYGDLIKLIRSFLINLYQDQGKIKEARMILSFFAEILEKMSKEINVKASEVKFPINNSQALELLRDPSKVLAINNFGKYFHKGKYEKIFSYIVLKNLTPEYILKDQKIDKLKSSDFELMKNIINGRKSIVYFTGYKWRSDPHCGVLTNVDYLMCRLPRQTSKTNRENALIALYPRVFLNNKSHGYEMINGVSSMNKKAFTKLCEDNGIEVEADSIKRLTEQEDQFGIWNEKAKQARIFKRYADIIICGDGFVIGDKW
jgi:hypothetical protein